MGLLQLPEDILKSILRRSVYWPGLPVGTEDQWKLSRDRKGLWLPLGTMSVSKDLRLLSLQVLLEEAKEQLEASLPKFEDAAEEVLEKLDEAYVQYYLMDDQEIWQHGLDVLDGFIADYEFPPGAEYLLKCGETLLWVQVHGTRGTLLTEPLRNTFSDRSLASSEECEVALLYNGLVKRVSLLQGFLKQ